VLDELESFPGVASVWCGPIGGPPRFQRKADELHYAASTMKVGVMVAAFRDLDLGQPVRVHNKHRSSVPDGPAFGNDQDDDGDPAVWARLGEEVPLRWLIERMIVRSSNLATNLVLSVTGFDSVNQVWRDAGAVRAHTDRGIEDTAARQRGITNEVTAADLAALMGALAGGKLAGPGETAAMLDILFAQEYLEDFGQGLPPGTQMASKNGWINGVRHCAAVIYPGDAAPYVLTVCTTGTLPDEQTCAMLGRVAAASWEAR
jgi:beta-lactamase class A